MELAVVLLILAALFVTAFVAVVLVLVGAVGTGLALRALWRAAGQV